MWTTNRTRRAYATPRPLRAAYLVPLNPTHALLDAIFDESMSRWGGRRTAVITTDGATIDESDWLFLDLWDADIIYSYESLDNTLRDRIAHCLAPAIIEIHRPDADPDDSHALRPKTDHFERALKSISVLPRLARIQEVRRDQLYEVLDQESGGKIERDLADSFGFLSNGGIHLNLSPYARRLSFREQDQEKQTPRFRGEDTISYLTEVVELQERLSSDDRLLFPSQMSDLFCPYLNVLKGFRTNWEDRLTLVIGSDQSDRLLYWNSIHRYKSLDSFRSNQVFRFDLARFKDGLPSWIEHLCGGVRNYRRRDGNGAANVQVISSSVDTASLERISKLVSKQFGIMSSSYQMAASEVLNTLAEKDPRKEYEHSSLSWPAWLWGDIKITQSIRIDQNEIDLPCVKPWHTEDFPLGPTTVGAWICDLDIERTEDHSRYSNITHRWMFPRRLALHKAVRIENYGPSGPHLRPPSRPTERGHLSLWDDPRWQRPTAQLPQDIEAFQQALIYQHPNSVEEQNYYDKKGPYVRLNDVRVSDKGRDFLGLLKFFRNLNEATTFLTNPFILSMISKLSPTDTSQDIDRISKMSGELLARFKDKAVTDEDVERGAKRVLELAARWVQKDSKTSEFISYTWIRKLMKETVKSHSDEADLDECIKFLRNQNFLLQGYGWRCHRCQHPNWVGLTEIKNSLNCAVCDSVEDAPVGGEANSHFMLNSFVSAAFGPTSAQDSVIWCLSHLIEQAQHSLMLTPALDIKDETNIPNGTDLDLLASVDGKIHYYEVKRSFAGINKRQIDDLIQVATLIRPDCAGFAVQNEGNKEVLTIEEIQLIRDALRKIDVEFVLLTGGNERFGFFNDGIPRNIGDAMRWSVWRSD